MLTCRELAQQLVSDYIDHQLPLRQRAGVLFHLLMCGHCRLFLRQFRQLPEVIRQRPSAPPDEAAVTALAARLHDLHRELDTDSGEK